ncbi:MAG: histidine phosphatase family protein [Gemmatimonadota bacterium]
MLILIVRHAQAGEHDAKKYPDDTERPLTGRGRKIHAEVSAALRARKIAPDVIVASPWKRAWQTAGIMAKEFSGRKKMQPIPGPSLAADPNMESITSDLGPIEGLECIALVGHEPWLSELASLLLTGEAHRLSLDLPKSGVIGIEAPKLEAGAGTLQFLLRPKLL